jgi:hypothetical protein
LVERPASGQRQSQIGARLKEIGQHHAQRQRNEGCGDKPAHCLQANAADGFGVARGRDPRNHGGEHQRRNDHLDQPQKDVGEDREITGNAGGPPPHRRPGCWQDSQPAPPATAAMAIRIVSLLRMKSPWLAPGTDAGLDTFILP